MRLKVRRLWWSIKRELPIQFGHERLTSYGGLELVHRYFQLIGLNSRIRRALRKHGDGSEYGCTHLVLLVVGLLVVGARRLKHLRSWPLIPCSRASAVSRAFPATVR
jgi:hypothetical protein